MRAFIFEVRHSCCVLNHNVHGQREAMQTQLYFLSTASDVVSK